MSIKHLKYPFMDGCKNLPRDKDDDLRNIRKWIETQPQLPKLNDEFLYLFLHCNYYNLEETKNNIKAYYSLRSTSPELFQNRSLSDPKLRTAFNNLFLALGPKNTPEGYEVLYFGFTEKWQNFVHTDITKATFMFIDVAISESGLCPGYIFVLDAKALTFSLFLKLHFGTILKCIKYFQEAASVRVLKIVVVNSVPLVDKLLALCRPFMFASLINKLEFHTAGCDLTNFYKTVPQECTFTEYGGTEGSIEEHYEKFMKLLETKYSKWIDDESIYAIEKPIEEPKPAKRSFFSFW